MSSDSLDGRVVFETRDRSSYSVCRRGLTGSSLEIDERFVVAGPERGKATGGYPDWLVGLRQRSGRKATGPERY
jgi:hypothetical protein